MENYNFLVSIAIIILMTKILGDLTNKVHLTQVVGALAAGVIIGPSGLGLIHETDFIACSAEIGVILLMFMAGMDTDINEIRKNAKACILIAGTGVIVPLLGGTAAYMFYFGESMSGFDSMLEAVFVGVLLTATSVSITVEALREMGKLEGRVGNTILGAAVLDDIIGIVVLTMVTSMKDTSVSVGAVLLKILAFSILMAVLAFLIFRFRTQIDANQHKHRITTYALGAVLLISFISEQFFGIADITGAFLLGLFLSKCEIRSEVLQKLSIPSYLFFSPIFFASVGLKVELTGMNGDLIAFSLLLLAVAVFTKVFGCGLGARISGFSLPESLQVGVGMVSRGEVALIVVQKGYAVGLLNPVLLPPIVIVVIVTTILAPVVLRKIM